MKVPSLPVMFLSEDVQIGTAQLIAADPSMGYASGKFEPTDSYDKTRHADTISDFALREVAVAIEVQGKDGENIETLSIAIQDYSAELDEIEVHVRLTSAEQYETLFPGAYEAERRHYASVSTKTDHGQQGLSATVENGSRVNHFSRIIKKISRIFRG